MKETRKQRSRVMRAVKAEGTAPEMLVRRLVHRLGYRYRLHRRDLPGKPDLVFSRRRKVVFVHGCFWHGHNCTRGARIPKANRGYWVRKIAGNRARDKKNMKALTEAGWKSLVLWECAMRDESNLRKVIEAFLLPH